MKERSGLALIVRFVLTNLLTGFLTAPDFIAYNYDCRRNLSLRLCRAIWRVQEFSWTIRSAENAKTALDGAHGGAAGGNRRRLLRRAVYKRAKRRGGRI